MNKISEIIGSPAISGLQKRENAKSGLFQQNLDAAKINQQAKANPAQCAGLLSVPEAAFPTIHEPLKSIVDGTEHLLDMLENYSREMEAPGKTLKEIQPLIDSIRQEASRLAAEAEKEPGDDALARIANECALTANVAYIKFYRGDLV
ncbi:MAG: hypothetical protein C4530_09280 [Desulfobacteraceae bacterium]|nr:MAG: hypothetical protein C4530_09280 [Desulfobacteraceae bacterium]